MKKQLISIFVLFVFSLMLFGIAIAQGVVVHKKNGISIRVPYNELDSITTYDYNDSPTLDNRSAVQNFTVNGVSFNMIRVEGGTFQMGATTEQSNGYQPLADESPVHSVTLSDYYIGETEITQELWKAVMDASPSSSISWKSEFGLGDKYPAYFISFVECLDFITKINQLTGQTFRMPTEAEWEYAARGGKESKGCLFSGSNNINEVAWYESNSCGKSHEVATLAPNELGIYDLSGNVAEWCSDWYGNYTSLSQIDPTGPTSGFYHVCRGGNWAQSPSVSRIACRDCMNDTNHDFTIGLRLAL